MDDSFVPGTDAYARRLRRAQACVRTLLRGVGEDPEREGLRDTPKVRKTFNWTCCARLPAARIVQDGERVVVGADARRAQTSPLVPQHPPSPSDSRPAARSPLPPFPPPPNLPQKYTTQRVAKAFLDMTQGYRQDRVR